MFTDIETWLLKILYFHELFFSYVNVKLCRNCTHSLNLFTVCFAVKGLRTAGLYQGTTQDTMASLKMEQTIPQWSQGLR